MFRQTGGGEGGGALKALIKFDHGLGEGGGGGGGGQKWHHLLGDTAGDSCSTGPGSKQCTRSDGIERDMKGHCGLASLDQ